jgi:hypothetical protein
MTYVYHSNVAAPCGVDDCKEKFHVEIEWAYHCKEKHPAFFKANEMAARFDIKTVVTEKSGEKQQ